MKGFHRLHELTLKKPTWVFFIFALTIVFSFWGLSRLKKELKLYDLEDPNFHSTIVLQKTKHEFRAPQIVTFIFSPVKTISDICSINQIFGHTTSEGITSVQYMSDFRAPKYIQDKVWFPKLLELKCEEATPLESAEKFLTEYRTYLPNPSKNFHEYTVSVKFEDDKSISTYIKTINKLAPEKLNVYILGNAAAKSFINEAFQRDLMKQGLVILLILILFRVAFGSLKGGFIFCGTLVVTIIITHGLMGLFNVPLDLLNSNLFLITAIAAVEDFLFLSQYRSQDWRDTFKTLIVPCFFTSFTTFIGFLSLCTSDLAIIQRFGLWGGIATMVEWSVLFVLMPALGIYFPSLVHWVKQEGQTFSKITNYLSIFKIPKWGSRLLMIIFVLCPFAIQLWNSPENKNEAFQPEHQVRKSIEYLKKNNEFEGMVEIIFKETDKDQILPYLESLKSHPNISGIDVMDTRIQKLTAGFPEYTQSMLRRDMISFKVFDHYLSLFNKERAFVLIKSIDTKILSETIKDLEIGCKTVRCSVSGEDAVYAEYSQKVAPTLLESFLVSLILVGFILYGLCKYTKNPDFFPLFISSIFGPLMMIPIIAVLQIPLSITTSIFAAVIVGLTGDNAIQYIFASNKSTLEGMELRGRGSALLIIFLVTSSLIFLFSELRPFQQLGILFAFGFFMSFVGDLWILRFLLERRNTP